MHSTKALLGRGVISTHHGQRRILKHSTPDFLTYLQKAVQTGIYRTNEEIEEMNERLQDTSEDLKRIRWHVPRGSFIHEYPKEYEILSMNPPPPFRPRTPLKDQRKAMNKFLRENRPTDRLARNYLMRQQKTNGGGGSATSDEYYRRLLGGSNAPKMNSAMGAKSALMNKAYAVAVKQYVLMRTENLSEKDAMHRVEELLKEQDFGEKTTSRSKAENLAKSKVDPSMPSKDRADAVFPRPEAPKSENAEDKNDTKLAMMHSNQQRAFEGMISWTDRLQKVPYRRWTVGASVALDHWIAKRVLGLSEETWLALIEGESPELMGRGRDIVMARHALFPETVLEEELIARQLDGNLQEEEEEEAEEDNNITDELQQILDNLGGWDDVKDKNDKDLDSPLSGFLGSSGPAVNSDDKILQMTEQLQEWRGKQLIRPYETWSEGEKKNFTIWLQDYVETLTPDSVLDKVDMDGTRKALLASPPQSREDSDKFWESIRDETAAEVFLQKMLLAKNIEGDDSSSHPFWQLEYSSQLKRLVELGSIRDIADEYSLDSDRSRFLARYGDYLLEGVDLDHLVPDTQGPIRGSDLSDRLQKQHSIGPTDRFRLEKMAFGTDAFGTEASQRARALYKAWNTFKAGRAHYEEKLFQHGLLGLTYKKPPSK